MLVVLRPRIIWQQEKTEVNKLGTDKNDVVKKTDYNALKSKVDGIDVSKYVGRTKYETDEKLFMIKLMRSKNRFPF